PEDPSSGAMPVTWLDTAAHSPLSLFLIRRCTGRRCPHTTPSVIALPEHCRRAGRRASLKNMKLYEASPTHDLTYSDVFLVPIRSGVASRLDVSLAPTDGTGATVPIVSANMTSVTGPRLAATLARRGGLGVLPQDLPLQELDAAIRWVKAQAPGYD